MAQTGYTPILIYGSGTTGNTPSAGNLTSSSAGAELAINYFDGKLFYKDNAGVVQTLATKGTGSIGGSTTQVQYNNAGALAGSANLTFNGTTLTAATGANFATTSGNVGIGTASPSQLVEASLSQNGKTQVKVTNVNAGANTSAGVLFGTSSGDNGYIGANGGAASSALGGANAVQVTNLTANPVVLATNNTERMRIDSSGNVLVGTTTTRNILTVTGPNAAVPSLGTASGTALFCPAGTTYGTMFGSTVGGDGWIQQQRVDTTATAYNLLLQPSGGNVGIGTASPGRKLDVVDVSRDPALEVGSAGIGATATQQLRFGYDTAGYGWVQAANFGTTVTSLSLNPRGGNVGIGTTSPSSYGRLGVMTPTANNGFFGIANSAGGAGGVQEAHYYGTTKISYYDTTLTNGTPGSETAFISFGTANSGTLAERMRITAAGNIVAGASAALATNATDGFLYVPTCAGTPTGTPTAITGMAPIVVNTTNNKLYFYSGGSWRDAGP